MELPIQITELVSKRNAPRNKKGDYYYKNGARVSRTKKENSDIQINTPGTTLTLHAISITFPASGLILLAFGMTLLLLE